MRYDIFIVWGNGLNYAPEIVNEIAIDSNFKIIRLKYHFFAHTETFIKDVYKCDTVPWDHLISKSRYLHSSPQKCMVIIVKNLRPQEQMVGSGEFKHIQCQNITNLKIRIRSKYNPKFLDANKQINPLPRGVSHEHIIHGTDYEDQVEYLLNYFGLGSINYYNRYNKLNYLLPWHLNLKPKTKIIEREQNISDLKCSIFNKGIIQIQDSPHFKYVKGDKDDYLSYVSKNIGVTLQENHFHQSFDHLISNFDLNYQEAEKKSCIIVNSGNIILDGLHRCSIMLKLGVKKVKCLVI